MPPSEDISGTCTSPVYRNHAGRVDLQHDPYCLRKHFTTQWGILKDSNNRHRRKNGSPTHSWTDDEIVIKTEGPDVGFCIDPPSRSTQAKPLHTQISSQLLLYRIVANFAAPPSTWGDPYKCAWSFDFWNRDDPSCLLTITDHKGAPMASFCGNGQASTEALQLIEWLTGMNCMHSYDYTPCGRSG